MSIEPCQRARIAFECSSDHSRDLGHEKAKSAIVRSVSRIESSDTDDADASSGSGGDAGVRGMAYRQLETAPGIEEDKTEGQSGTGGDSPGNPGAMVSGDGLQKT